LHGYDEAAPTPLEVALKRHGPLRPGNPKRVASEFLVIAPQLPVAGDVWQRYAHEVRALVEAASKRYEGDVARFYLSGFSFGANGVFDLAAVEPQFWAALWAVDPTRVPKHDLQRPVWLSFGEVARHRKREFIAALDLEPARPAARGERVYADDGDDHVGAARRAYGEERTYAWLLTKRLA
jgi:predicted peptidase